MEAGEGDAAKGRRREHAKVVQVSAAPKHTVTMNVPGQGLCAFYYAGVFTASVSQQQLFETALAPSITSVLNGLNATVLCYGQTGSGKTYTFFGPEGALSDGEPGADGALSASTGAVLRVCREMLRARELLLASAQVRVSLAVQFVEIYDDKVTDLLSGRPVQLRRESGEVVGAPETPIDSFAGALEVLRTGQSRKRFASTAMN